MSSRYWVVGGEYTDTNFSRLVDGKSLALQIVAQHRDQRRFVLDDQDEGLHRLP